MAFQARLFPNPHCSGEVHNAGHVGGIKEEIDFPGNGLCLSMPDPPMVCVGRSLWIPGACLTVYAPGTYSVCMGKPLWIPGPRGLWPPKSRASKNDPVQGKKNTRGLGQPDSIIESKLFSSSPRLRPSPPPGAVNPTSGYPIAPIGPKAKVTRSPTAFLVGSWPRAIHHRVNDPGHLA